MIGVLVERIILSLEGVDGVLGVVGVLDLSSYLVGLGVLTTGLSPILVQR